MTDLVLLRELIKNELACGHREDLSCVLSRCNLDVLFESIAVRGSLPYAPNAIALCFDFLAVKTIQSCSRFSTCAKFRSWYTERLKVTLSIDVASPKCKAFTSALGRVHALAVRSANQLRAPEEGEIMSQTIRPLPLVLRETMVRTRNVNPLETYKRKARNSTKSSKSPRTTYTFHSSEPSLSSGASTHDFQLETTQPITPSQASIPHPVEASEEGSVLPREQTPTKLGSRNTFKDALKNEVIELVTEFAEVSSLIQSMTLASLPREKTSLSSLLRQSHRDQNRPRQPNRC